MMKWWNRWWIECIHTCIHVWWCLLHFIHSHTILMQLCACMYAHILTLSLTHVCVCVHACSHACDWHHIHLFLLMWWYEWWIECRWQWVPCLLLSFTLPSLLHSSIHIHVCTPTWSAWSPFNSAFIYATLIIHLLHFIILIFALSCELLGWPGSPSGRPTRTLQVFCHPPFFEPPSPVRHKWMKMNEIMMMMKWEWHH